MGNHTVPKYLFDLTQAIDRWASECEIERSLESSKLNRDIELQALEERILKCLGAAVILQWDDLPATMRHGLFDDAALMSDPKQRFRLKQEIARFLNEHGHDTQ